MTERQISHKQPIHLSFAMDEFVQRIPLTSHPNNGAAAQFFAKS